MTDEELDREFKPNGRRPQSAIAQMFSQELQDIFRIENSIADLDAQVDKRRKRISAQTSELEALEARIREMERRLKMQTGGELPPPVPASTSTAPPTPQKDVIREQDEEQEAGQDKIKSEQAAENKYAAAGSRPGTTRPGQQAVSGALPPTPIGSEDGDGERDT